MRFLVFLSFLTFLAGCKTKQPSFGGGCETLGTVRDFQGLDGCGFLIELADGDLLYPLSLPEGFSLSNKQVVRFNYSIRKDAMTICIAEKAAVDISCIEEVRGDVSTCTDTKNPFSVPWMDQAIDRHNPNKVIKYKMENKRPAYLFQSIPTSFLYDCEGKLLGQTAGDSKDNCHAKYLNRFKKGKVIWQGEGIWD